MNEEQETLALEEIESELMLRSAPDVPTDPVAMTVVPSDFTSAKYPAVPVLPAVPDVIALAAIEEVPADAEAAAKAVAPNVSVTSKVPVTATLTAGCAPV
jgi:hypothetical protein